MLGSSVSTSTHLHKRGTFPSFEEPEAHHERAKFPFFKVIKWAHFSEWSEEFSQPRQKSIMKKGKKEIKGHWIGVCAAWDWSGSERESKKLARTFSLFTIKHSFHIHAINNVFIPLRKLMAIYVIHTGPPCACVSNALLSLSLRMQRKFTCFNIIAPGFIDIRARFRTLWLMFPSRSSYLLSRSLTRLFMVGDQYKQRRLHDT